MSRMFSLSCEHTFQVILMRFLFVINVRNNEPPEQLGYTDKSTLRQNPHRMPCGRYGIRPLLARVLI